MTRFTRPDAVGEAPLATDHGPALTFDGADLLLRRLEFAVRNRLDGLLQGNYLGLVPGPGSEAGSRGRTCRATTSAGWIGR